MSNLFHLAQDAAKALTAYEKGLAKKKAGHTDTINAVIEYGKALREGRKVHASHKVFSKWIEENDLDQTKPFDQPQERSAAMQIAEIVINGTSSVDRIFECPNSWPGTIMKWMRKQSWFETKPNALRRPINPRNEPRSAGRGKTSPSLFRSLQLLCLRVCLNSLPKRKSESGSTLSSSAHQWSGPTNTAMSK